MSTDIALQVLQGDVVDKASTSTAAEARPGEASAVCKLS